MLIRGIRGWCLVLGLVTGGAATWGCVGESPCEYTATCPPPEAGVEDETTGSDGLGAASDTEDLNPTEPAAPEPADTEPTEPADDGTKPIPTITFPPVLPVSPEPPPDAGQAGDFDADVTAPEVDAEVTEPEVTEPEVTEPEVTEPEVTEPEVTEPEVTEPEVTEPEVTEPEITCADDHGGCDLLVGCSDTLAGPECGACPNGYVGDGWTGCAPTLLSLGLSHGRLSPEIDQGLDVYDVVIPVFIQNLSLTPTVPAGASATIRGAAIVSGATWTSPALNFGLDTVTILVEQVGQPSSEYTLRVTRGADSPGYIKASNPGPDDWFGYSSTLSGDGSTLAVGAPHEDGNGDAAEDAGAVYVFVRSGNAWVQQAYLKASNAEAGDLFGSSVALSGDGNTLVVGAYREDSNATGVGGAETNNSASDAGAAYVFVRSGNAWVQQAYLKASNTEAGDVFGFSVALSKDGNALAIGARQQDLLAGAVYVFTRIGSGWGQQAFLKASNANGYDRFGTSVALSSDATTLAVGATGEASNATGTSGAGQSNNDASNAGAVYVFIRSGSVWSQQAYIKASNADAGDWFGRSVTLSDDGNALAAGADSEDGNGSGPANNQTPGAGAVYVFSRNGSAWEQRAYIKAPNTDVDVGFGWATVMSGDGNTLAVGALGENSSGTGIRTGGATDTTAADSGAAYVYAKHGSVWMLQAYIKAPNAQSSDWFGNSIALSNDASTLAVGATGEASNATGFAGNQNNNSMAAAGAAYVYR